MASCLRSRRQYSSTTLDGAHLPVCQMMTLTLERYPAAARGARVHCRLCKSCREYNLKGAPAKIAEDRAHDLTGSTDEIGYVLLCEPYFE